MGKHDFHDEDDKPDPKAGRVFEFECPECNAHNPYDDGFVAGEQVLCFYCGAEFDVRVSDGKVKLKAT